jgi:hypothetical protein
MEFTKNGLSIILYKNISEPDEIFLKRGWFIVSQPDIKKNYDEILRLSKVWENIKFKSCVYNKNLMEKIEEMNKYT